MHETVNGFELSTNVRILSAVEQVLDRRMLRVTTKDMLGLLAPALLSKSSHRTDPTSRDSLVRLIDISDGHNGQVADITEVTERNSSTGLDTKLGDLVVRYVEADRHAEEVAICKALLLNDAVWVWSQILVLPSSPCSSTHPL